MKGRDALQSLLGEQLAQLDVTPFRDAWNQLRMEYDAYMLGHDSALLFDQLINTDQQSSTFMFNVIRKLALFFFDELLRNGQLLVSLVVLALFAVLLEALKHSFSSQRVGRVASLIIMVILMSIAVQSLYVALEYAGAAVERLSDFMIALFPLFLSLLAVSGNLLAVAAVEPILLLMTQWMANVISGFVFPLIFFSTLLLMAGSLHEHYKVNRFAALLRTVAMSVLAVMFTLFLGVLSFQGAFAMSADALTLRAARFVTGNFVPVVGKMFADATDTVLSVSLMLKNTVGMVGLLLIVLICAFPALKVLVLALIYKLCSAVLQPLGDTPLAQTLDEMGKSLLFVFGSLAILCLMFFLCLTILICFANMTLMFR